MEADLTQIAALNFNLVNIQYFDFQHMQQQMGRSLIDFLERCRNHGIWARIFMRTELYGGAYSNTADTDLASYIEDAYLPGNDRVFSYELLWEPMAGTQTTGGGYNQGRTTIDPDWRSWVTDQYGSIASAEQIWGYPPPLDASGQLTNPTDQEIANDGEWRIMVAAYRRFLEDYFGRNIGLIARTIRQLDPDTLLSYRNWTTMTDVHNFNTGYDIGTAAAHLDFFSPERYQPVLGWPDDRTYGLVVAYSRYRTGGKPVHWTEYGYNIAADSGSQAALDAQSAVCDTMMRQVVDDGSNGGAVWWWAGGVMVTDGSDFGIVDPAGNPRECAQVLSQWNTTLAATPPDNAPTSNPLTLTVDRDADSRGSYGLFLNWQDSYVQARNAGDFVVLADQGTGTTTATMPMIQTGNVPYTGAGPLKFANAEFGGVQIVCPNLNVTVENGASVAIPVGAACQFTPTLVNTGEASWLPASASAGGVILHTSLGDVPLSLSVPSLQRTAMGPLAVTMGQAAINLTGRLRIASSADFGEVLNLTLTPDTGTCVITTTAAPAITAPAQGATGTIQFNSDAACSWVASSTGPWVTVTPTYGSGSGTVTYTVPPNTGPARQTTIIVANHPFTVTEAASPAPVPVAAPTLSAAALNFGGQNVGAMSSGQTVTLTNSSTAALNLSGVSIGGVNGADFAQTNTCGASVAAGTSCPIVVTFIPSAAGMRTAALFVAGNIGGTSPTVSLSGIGQATGAAPAIQSIVDAWGYTAGIAPGLWVTITGTSLAGPPQSWNLAGVQQLPTTLGGVTVQFNGAPAALFYVSATQINALVPASVSPGPVQVVVQWNGLHSNPFVITATATQPAVYAPPSANGSTFFVTAALEGTATLVGNAATDSRVIRAAYPGDILDLYMIGLGATIDPSKFVTDQVFQGAFPVSAPVTATVGGENAPVVFAGLTSPGLYLVRVSIPADLAAGQQPLQVTAGAAHTRSSLVLTVATPPPSLIQSDKGIRIRKGEVYRLQFWARTNGADTVRVEIGGFTAAIALDPVWRQYTLYFEATDPSALLDFDLGGVLLDRVTLQ